MARRANPPGRPAKPGRAASTPPARRKRAAAAPAVEADAPPPPPAELGRLSPAQLRDRLADPAVPLAQLEPYLRVVTDERGALTLVANPEYVDVEDDALLRTRGMGIMNAFNYAARERRRRTFEHRLIESSAPIVLAEGDSWFEYPVFLEDTIDALASDFNVFCLSAAGETMAEMAGNAEVVEHYVGLARRLGKSNPVRAVILSAGGNDIVGDTLATCVKRFEPGAKAEALLDRGALKDVLDRVMQGYRGLIAKLRAVKDDIPILIHGYDHALPQNRPLPQGHPWDADFLVRRWIPRDGWLAEPLGRRLVVEPKLQAAIVRLMIDAFYARLGEIGDTKGKGAIKGVHLVDNRGVVAGRWNDELHPTDAGFVDVAENFRQVLKRLS